MLAASSGVKEKSSISVAQHGDVFVFVGAVPGVLSTNNEGAILDF